ncbi:Ectoderm-neural cortex protein 1 [Lecanora helva]
MDPATVSGLVAAEQVVSTTVEGGAVAAYGLAQSTQPLSATFTRVSSEAFLPRTKHTLTVVSGQAYIFGGEAEDGKLTGDEIHIVSLPLKKAGNEGKPDYKVVPSLGEGEDGKVPGPRAGHTACAVGERIYVFGGKGKENDPIEEKGRVWVFSTQTLAWSYLDPASDASIPPARFLHGAVASEHPLPNTNASEKASYGEQIQSSISKIPSLIGQGSALQEPHGSLVISGGFSSDADVLNGSWIFNIIAQTWSALPPTPSPSPSPPSLALTHNRLYLISSSSDLGSELHYLPFTRETYSDSRGEGEVGLTTAKDEWTTLPFPTNPLTPGPRPRKGAGLIPVTTGNGREYLLYFFGERASPPDSTSKSSPEDPVFWSDVWSYQVPAQNMTAAGIKDATRLAMGIQTGEGSWAEVNVVTVIEGDTEGKSHPGPRGWFASSPVGRDVDGGGVVLWGGVNGKGEVEGDGWIINVAPK